MAKISLLDAFSGLKIKKKKIFSSALIPSLLNLNEMIVTYRLIQQFNE